MTLKKNLNMIESDDTVSSSSDFIIRPRQYRVMVNDRILMLTAEEVLRQHVRVNACIYCFTEYTIEFNIAAHKGYEIVLADFPAMVELYNAFREHWRRDRDNDEFRPRLYIEFLNLITDHFTNNGTYMGSSFPEEAAKMYSSIVFEFNNCDHLHGIGQEM